MNLLDELRTHRLLAIVRGPEPAAVGVGSPLLGDAVRGGDPAALRERAAAFLAAVRR